MPGAERSPRTNTDAVAPVEVDAPIVRLRPVTAAKVPNPALPTANIANSDTHPFGSTEDGYAEKVKRQTVLEQHVNYWDRDNDGVIWPMDTFRGFRELGYNFIWSCIALYIIHVNFSFPSGNSWIPDPYFRIHTKNIHRTKHGSDTGAYDTEGRFVPQKFHELFEKHSSLPDKDGLTKRDLFNAVYAQRACGDIIGWGGEAFEWISTWLLLWPADGIIRKDDVRAVIDGSIFWRIARQRGVDLRGADPSRTTNKH